MKYKIFFLFIFIFVSLCCLSAQVDNEVDIQQNESLINLLLSEVQFVLDRLVISNNYQLNEIPMYGGNKITDEQIHSNNNFISEMEQIVQSVDNEYETIEEVSEHMMFRGWEFFDQNDFVMAIKRFNQGWLVNPSSADVYWGFGNYLGILEVFEGAIVFLRISLCYDSNNAYVYTDLAKSYNMNGFKLTSEGNEEALEENLKKAIEIIEMGLEIEELGRLYHHYAVSLFYLDRYAESYEQIQKAIELDEQINPNFISLVKSKL